MKHTGVFCYIAGIVLAVSTGCASNSAVPLEKPLWASYDTIERAYPNESYIARIGFASSADAAGALAEGELAAYFSHTVQTSSTATENMVSKDGKTSIESRSIARTVKVDALRDLFAVHRTEAWADKKQKRTVVCAYIDRAEAWTLYEGHVISAQKRFHSAYDAAIRESDPLKRIVLLKQCAIPGEEYVEVLDYARLLSPRAEGAYAKEREAVAGVENRIALAKQEAVMRIVAKNDDTGRVSRMVETLFSQEGFLFTTKANQTVYEVLVSLESHKQTHGDMLTCEPEITVSVKNSAEIIFSYAKTLPRINGFAEAAALVDKKLYASVEQELNQSLISEFNSVIK